jgi:hypothetical protein
MRNQNSSLACGNLQYVEIGKPREICALCRKKVHVRLAAKAARKDCVIQAGIREKPNQPATRLTMSRARSFSRTLKFLSQFCWGGMTLSEFIFDAFSIAHSTFHFRPMSEAKRHSPEHLLQGKRRKILTDSLRRVAMLKAKDNGIQHDSSAGHVIPAVSLFYVIGNHVSI